MSHHHEPTFLEAGNESPGPAAAERSVRSGKTTHWPPAATRQGGPRPGSGGRGARLLSFPAHPPSPRPCSPSPVAHVGPSPPSFYLPGTLPGGHRSGASCAVESVPGAPPKPCHIQTRCGLRDSPPGEPPGPQTSLLRSASRLLRRVLQGTALRPPLRPGRWGEPRGKQVS